MNLNKKSKLSYSPEHVLHILIIEIVIEKLIPMYTEFLLQTKLNNSIFKLRHVELENLHTFQYIL